VVEAVLALLEVQVERVGRHPVELDEPTLGVRPEALDAVDVALAAGEVVLLVVDPQVLLVADVDQAVVATPAVGVDDAVGKLRGHRSILVLGGTWWGLFLDHPLFRTKIREWLKVLRKRNVAVVFATQSLADIGRGGHPAGDPGAVPDAHPAAQRCDGTGGVMR
jgi:type IV secretion system protein VirB4